MLRDFFVEVAQNPKIGMALGGTVSGLGVAATWFNFAKEFINEAAIPLGFVLSIVALIAQIVRIKNDRAANRRAEAAERRAEELHRKQMGE